MSAELARYAVTEKKSRGRGFAEKPHRYRCDFERDRDRIIHCSAFRRLEGKTQVFTPGLDDYYRTRLTHTIEVAQIGRTIARALNVSEPLTEAVCLAHDLGHAPFGHAGETVLNNLMAEFGGFEHNTQTVRIVELLEHPYPDFKGLNLMYETRLGLARHRGAYDNPSGDDFAEKNCSLEGQIANIADRIAYNCHDLEDGLRARILLPDQLSAVAIFTEARKRINANKITDHTIKRTRTAKAIIDKLVGDCIDASKAGLAEVKVVCLHDVYSKTENLVVFSPQSESQLRQLEKFLLDNFYHHQTLLASAEKTRTRLSSLFAKLCENPDLMPGYFRSFIAEHGLERTVCDYIAGMTDRFCLNMLEQS